MSGAVAVTAAVVSIAVAAEVATPFAIVAAVGATVGAVGAITHVKELQYAGAAIGAVGMIGGLASAAGMFGEAGSIFGSASGGALEGIAQGTTAAENASPFVGAAGAATDGGSWASSAVGATTSGYSDVGALMEGQGIVAGDGGPSVIQTVTAGMSPPTATPSVPTAASPNVNPNMGLIESVPPDSQGVPGFESPTKSFDTWAGAGDSSPQAPTTRYIGPSAGTEAPDPVPDSPVTGKNPGAWFDSPADRPAVLDQNGRLTAIPQGDGEGGTLGTTNNPAAPGYGIQNNPPLADINGNAAPKPSDISGDNPTPGLGSGSQPLSANPTDAQIGIRASSAVNANPLDAGIPGSAAAAAKAAGAADSSTWSDILGFVNKNPLLAYGAIQTAGSFLSGAASPLPQAQVDELESRRRANDAAVALSNQQQQLIARRMANSSGMPVASRIPDGLINSSGAVTGHV